MKKKPTTSNEPAPEAAPPAARYLVGIDLGTTNSAMAFVDTQDAERAVRDFRIPQLVAPGTVEARDVLPSFHYEAAAGEFGAGALALPWAPQAGPRTAVGLFARDHGTTVPGRLVGSAKSWLCHSGVNRMASLLPWQGAADVERLSPVAVSARYLGHLRAAWNHAHPRHPLETQEVVLTVPASFDEVARELTVEAAAQAGLPRVVLLEEPQAAFYAWLHAQGDAWAKRVRAGQRILVCDVGGGTTDFTLIEVEPGKRGEVLFHRVAVGEHLILGGDNLDLALAHHIEDRIAGTGKLEPRRWGTLVRTCRQVKETLLGADPPERLTVNVAGSGSRLIGAALTCEVTRAEVAALALEGFMPRVELDASPAARRSGFQEFSLPYAPDPAITRYLAAFLRAHPATAAEAAAAGGRGRKAARDPVLPDLVLFNGGWFESALLRDRLVEVLTSWFGEARKAGKKAPIEVLESARLDLAVARGAAYYGRVRRGEGVRITGGLGRAYYVGVDTGREEERSAVCLLPAGTEEGQGVDLSERSFELLIRRPVEFPLYVSSTRTGDAPGALVAADERELTPLPPIRTVLASGRKGAADRVRVHLHARRTEIGTLELWCAEPTTERKWRLQFDVRAAVAGGATRPGAAAAATGTATVAEQAAPSGAPAAAPAAETTAKPAGRAAVRLHAEFDQTAVNAGAALIRATFAPAGGAGVGSAPGTAAHAPEGLVRRLEHAVEAPRGEWSPTLLRAWWEVLMEVVDGRGLGVGHEARWLNLTGYALRPGWGVALDDWRTAQTWKVFGTKLANPRNEQCRAEWWILWRRVAGGLGEGQQQTLVEPLLAAWRERLKLTPASRRGGGGGGAGGASGEVREPAYPFGTHEGAEVWRLLGSLELIRPALKLELGELLFNFLRRDAAPALRLSALWALGRLGARVPSYGPLNALVPAEAIEDWARRLLALDLERPEELTSFALVQMTRRTRDRYRDVSEELRGQAASWLAGRAAPARLIELVREGAVLAEEEERQVFGESLPPGLRLEPQAEADGGR